MKIILYLLNSIIYIIIVIPFKIILLLINLIKKIVLLFKNNKALHQRLLQLNYQQFEDYIFNQLKKLNFKNIIKTKTVGDYGIDIIATKNNKKYGFQCKRYQNKIGLKAIQEVKAGQNYYQLDYCIVVTNNTYTSSAKILAQKNNVILWDINTLKLIETKTKYKPKTKRLITYFTSSILLIIFIILYLKTKSNFIILLSILVLVINLIIILLNKIKRKEDLILIHYD